VEEVEGIKEYMAQQKRKGLCVKLEQISQQMAPTQSRKEVKREFVKDFRKMFPKKGDGR
jgi:hypothetical protein